MTEVTAKIIADLSAKAVVSVTLSDIASDLGRYLNQMPTADIPQWLLSDMARWHKTACDALDQSRQVHETA